MFSRALQRVHFLKVFLVTGIPSSIHVNPYFIFLGASFSSVSGIKTKLRELFLEAGSALDSDDNLSEDKM